MLSTRYQRRLVLTILISLSAPVVSANSDDAPEIVINNFKKQHPAHAIERVSKESHFGQTLYEVKLDDPHAQHEQALYNAQGEEVAHETPIAVDALPKAVKNTLNTEFNGFKILDAEKISHPHDNQLVEYEIDLNQGEQYWELVIKPNGQIVTQVQQ